MQTVVAPWHTATLKTRPTVGGLIETAISSAPADKRPGWIRTPEEVKQILASSGTSITAWSVANGFPPQAVYLVLNGLSKATYGQGHRIAVALGLKAKPKNDL